MPSDIRFEVERDIARITVTGRLDTANAPSLTEQLKTLTGKVINKVVFFVNDLEYISSAGLRAIVVAKQKIGPETQVYIIGPKPMVRDVIKMTGFESFLIIQDTFNA